MDARDLQDLVENWVKTLQPYSKEVWEMLVRGMVIERYAVTGIVAVALLAVGFIAALLWRKTLAQKYSGDGWMTGAVMATVASGGLFVALLVNGYHSIVAYVAPNYFVLRTLVK